MSRLTISRLVLPALLLAASLLAVGGYRLRAGHWPGLPDHRAQVADVIVAPKQSRAVLYWRDPDGKPDFSPTSKATPDGRVYLPVYEEEEQAVAARKPPGPVQAAKASPRTVLYYRNPMGLPDTSPAPKKDSMGMSYIPVYEGDEPDDGTTFKVSLDRVAHRVRCAAPPHPSNPCARRCSH